MTRQHSLDAAHLGLALVIGVGITLGLLMLMSLLVTQRVTGSPRPSPLVFELIEWSVADSVRAHEIAPEVSAPVSRTPQAQAFDPPPAPQPAAPAPPDIATERRVPDAPSVSERIDASALINRSLDWVKSQRWDPPDDDQSDEFTPLPLDPRTHGPVESDGVDERLEVYRLPNGGFKVKMETWFGKVQCFEVPAQDDLDAFSERVWMLSRC